MGTPWKRAEKMQNPNTCRGNNTIQHNHNCIDIENFLNLSKKSPIDFKCVINNSHFIVMALLFLLDIHFHRHYPTPALVAIYFYSFRLSWTSLSGVCPFIMRPDGFGWAL